MKMRHHSIVVLFSVMLFALARVADGQSTQPVVQPSDLDGMLKPSGTNARPLQPLPDPPKFLPTGEVDPATTQPVNVMREGTFVMHRTGRLVKSGDGSQQELLLDPVSPTDSPLPMRVLPNLELMAMENASRNVARELHFTVTGMVTEYNNANCILLERSSEPTSLEQALSANAATLSRAVDASAPTTTAPADVRSMPADQVLDRMLKSPAASEPKPMKPPAEPPRPDMTTGANAVPPGAPQINVMREGTFIMDRSGRLSKSADGQQYEFTFDADGRAMRDPPLIILPNLKLTLMQKSVLGASRDLRFRVTGMTTEYKGRNYLLLQKVVVVPDAFEQF